MNKKQKEIIAVVSRLQSAQAALESTVQHIVRSGNIDLVNDVNLARWELRCALEDLGVAQPPRKKLDAIGEK